MKFYRCEHCGNIVIYLKDAGVPVVCCGERDAGTEAWNSGRLRGKARSPLWKKDGSRVTVSVGAAEHPMIPEHFIQWILWRLPRGFSRNCWRAGTQGVFQLSEHDKVVSAYEYCNLHGL